MKLIVLLLAVMCFAMLVTAKPTTEDDEFAPINAPDEPEGGLSDDVSSSWILSCSNL